MKKIARAMAALQVAKIVVKGTEPEARLLYRLLTMFGGQAVPPIEAWPLLRLEPMSYLMPEVQKVATRGLLVAVMNLCQEHRDAHRGRPLSKRDKQLWKQDSIGLRRDGSLFVDGGVVLRAMLDTRWEPRRAD